MIPTPAAFQTAIRGSHQVVSRVRVVEPGQIGTNLLGRDLNIIAGSVTLDSSADIRGSLDLDLAEPWPQGTTVNDIVPYGTELQVSRGISTGNGQIIRVPLGIYRVIDVEQDEAPFENLHIVARDRMSLVQESDLLFPSYISPTMTYGQVVTRFIHGDTTLPGIFPTSVTIVWDDVSSVTGMNKTLGRAGGAVVERDRFGFLDDLLKGLGKIWYFDYQGILQIKTPVTTQQDPVFSVNAGKNGVLVKVDRSLTRTGACSAVVVTGEAFDDVRPPRGVAYDNNPLSPTWFNGPFGMVPKFLTSSTIKGNTAVESDAMAQRAAEVELAKSRGLPYAVNFEMIPNPSLEPYDTIEVVYPLDLRTDPHTRRENHVLEQVQIGLGADEGMLGKTRLSVTVV